LTYPDASGIILTYDNTSTCNITWEKTGAIANVTLKYATDGSTFNNTIISNYSASASPYEWLIPDKIGANLKVKIEDSADSLVNDTSSNPFAINGSILLNTPNGGENLTVHSFAYINWTPQGTYPSGTLNLYYKNDSAGSWIPISSASHQEPTTPPRAITGQTSLMTLRPMPLSRQRPLQMPLLMSMTPQMPSSG